ncbi:hypothetical protein JYG30_20830 [Fibrella sp. USSR17]
MKTSIKLLLGLALALIVSMFGAAISLRSQYDKIDKSDSYARWQKKPLPTFHSVHISGPSAAVVQIEPGSTTRLLADSVNGLRRASFTFRVERDTLFLNLDQTGGWLFRVDDEDAEWHSPQLVVQLPKLESVTTSNANSQIHGFNGDKLTLKQQERGGITLIEQVRFAQFSASLSGRSQLVLNQINNQFKQGRISVRDSARLFQYTDFKEGLTLEASPTATLRLTGKALQQSRQ